MDTDPLIAVERTGPVTVLTLNRPGRHNSLVPELLVQLLEALEETGRDDSIGAVVLAAAGPSFSTGGDVRRFWEERQRLADYATGIVGLLNDVVVSMMRLPQPIVAAVHGPVTGGSLGLILASDVVLVGPGASFTAWYGPVGFAPDGGWTALLPGVIGRQRVAHLLLTNSTMTARQATDWGLAARMVEEGDVRDEAVATATVIAGQVGGSVRHAKARLRYNPADIANRLEDERRRFVDQIVTDEARAGMARFLGID